MEGIYYSMLFLAVKSIAWYLKTLFADSFTDHINKHASMHVDDTHTSICSSWLFWFRMISACCWFSVALALIILSLVWQRASRSGFSDWDSYQHHVKHQSGDMILQLQEINRYFKFRLLRAKDVWRTGFTNNLTTIVLYVCKQIYCIFLTFFFCKIAKDIPLDELVVAKSVN